MSAPDTILYLEKTESVLWPEISRAVFCGMPRRIILRTAERRKSWNNKPGPPAASVSRSHVGFFPRSNSAAASEALGVSMGECSGGARQICCKQRYLRVKY